MSFCHRILLAWLLCGVVHATNENNFYHAFRYPLLFGHRLDYCMQDHHVCGLPVANRYCEAMGYEKSVDQVIDYNIGTTRAFETGTNCKGWQCNGFKMIRCVATFKHKPASVYYYRQQKFVYPQYNHARVDWCYKNGKQCGAPAAYSFCRRMGFSRAEAYSKQEGVSQTRALSNQRVCVGKLCNGFSSITCYR